LVLDYARTITYPPSCYYTLPFIPSLQGRGIAYVYPFLQGRGIAYVYPFLQGKGIAYVYPFLLGKTAFV
jgi:hypothetical protein